MLHRVTRLFVTLPGAAETAQLAVFDEVLSRLADGIETRARAALAETLSANSVAPPRLLDALARDEEILVAGPVLERSDAISDHLLADYATTLGQEHLLAISKRRALGEGVTDILVERGDRQVVRSVARNQTARFSPIGFGRRVDRSSDDETLAEIVALRRDVPVEDFRRLIERASEVVRRRLIAKSPHRAAEIAGILGAIAAQVEPKQRDYSNAERIVERLRATDQLDDLAIYDFASKRCFEETVVALAALNALPYSAVEEAFDSQNASVLIIFTKAAQLSWHSALAILQLQAGEGGLAPQTIEDYRAGYQKLLPQTAQRVVRFYKVRSSVAGPGKAN